MDASTPMPADLQRQQDRKRKRKAILAGGVVLGLGAAVTLAAWSDDVFADGVFDTGSFNMQGNASPTTAEDSWLEHHTEAATDGAGPAALTFRQELSDSANPTTLQYNETVWAPFSVRLDADTDTPGTFSLTGIDFGTGTSALTAAGVLKYSVYTGVAATECAATASNATPSADAVWYGENPVGTIPADISATALNVGADSAAGTPVNMCLGIKLDSNEKAHMGADPVSIVWEFTATANTP